MRCSYTGCAVNHSGDRIEGSQIYLVTYVEPINTSVLNAVALYSSRSGGTSFTSKLTGTDGNAFFWVDGLSGGNAYHTANGQERGRLRDTGSWINDSGCNAARVQNTDADLDFEISYEYELIKNQSALKARLQELHG